MGNPLKPSGRALQAHKPWARGRVICKASQLKLAVVLFALFFEPVQLPHQKHKAGKA